MYTKNARVIVSQSWQIKGQKKQTQTVAEFKFQFGITTETIESILEALEADVYMTDAPLFAQIIINRESF